MPTSLATKVDCELDYKERYIEVDKLRPTHVNSEAQLYVTFGGAACGGVKSDCTIVRL